MPGFVGRMQMPSAERISANESTGGGGAGAATIGHSQHTMNRHVCTGKLRVCEAIMMPATTKVPTVIRMRPGFLLQQGFSRCNDNYGRHPLSEGKSANGKKCICSKLGCRPHRSKLTDRSCPAHLKFLANAPAAGLGRHHPWVMPCTCALESYS